MMVAVTFPGMGVIVPQPGVNPTDSLPLSVRTFPGMLGCIHWGEHLTINDSSTYQNRIKNNSSALLTLKMTATLNGLNATLDTSHPLPPKAQGIM
jgi:hypothetical protein